MACPSFPSAGESKRENSFSIWLKRESEKDNGSFISDEKTNPLAVTLLLCRKYFFRFF